MVFTAAAGMPFPSLERQSCTRVGCLGWVSCPGVAGTSFDVPSPRHAKNIHYFFQSVIGYAPSNFPKPTVAGPYWQLSIIRDQLQANALQFQNYSANEKLLFLRKFYLFKNLPYPRQIQCFWYVSCKIQRKVRTYDSAR